MPQEQPTYFSYLLRLRKSNQSGRIVWRASLQSTRSGEEHHFPDLTALVKFLIGQFREIEDVSRE